MRPPKPILERFIEKIELIPFHECWEWSGYIEASGYGTFRWTTKKVKAHRASYLLFKGHIPKGILVCHRCDNPSCVNPDHLFLGTHVDNNQDCLRKGRRPSKKMFSKEQVQRIRMLKSKGWTHDMLAHKFKASKSTIGNICGKNNRETYYEPDMKDMKEVH